MLEAPPWVRGGGCRRRWGWLPSLRHVLWVLELEVWLLGDLVGHGRDGWRGFQGPVYRGSMENRTLRLPPLCSGRSLAGVNHGAVPHDAVLAREVPLGGAFAEGFMWHASHSRGESWGSLSFCLSPLPPARR